MQTSALRKDLLPAFLLLALTLAGRLLPHPANFTPVAAAGMMAMALIETRWLALLVPALGLTLSNFFLPFEHPMTMVLINLGFLLPAFLGLRLRNTVQSGPVLGHSLQNGLASGLIFYFLSNLGVFLWGGLYSLTTGFTEHTLEGALLLAFIGISTLLAQLAMTRAYGQGRTLTAANLQFSAIVFASLRIAVLMPCSTSTKTSLPHSFSMISSRETSSPLRRSSRMSNSMGIFSSFTGLPAWRSS